MTKSQAIKAVKALGYVTHYHTGESGDHGYGSRLYFHKPAAKFGENGLPVSNIATVSKVGRVWCISEIA